MTSIECSELLLKGQLPVMFLLVFDVPFYIVEVRPAHGKSGVSHLPVKLKISWAVGLRPLRAPLLHFLDDLLQRMILRKGEQRMDVILDASDRDRWTVLFSEDAGLIRKQGIAIVLGNPRSMVLGAVHEMNQVFHK
jgi:hypothetical protein